MVRLWHVFECHLDALDLLMLTLNRFQASQLLGIVNGRFHLPAQKTGRRLRIFGKGGLKGTPS